MSVLPTYQLSCQERLIVSKAIEEYRSTQRIPLIGEKSRWRTLVSSFSSSRIRCIQIAHIAFRTCFGNLWTTREKICNRQQTKHIGNSKQDSTQASISLFRKVRNHSDLPRSNCLFCLAAQTVVPCRCRIVVSLANSSRTSACCVVASLLSSIPTSG